VVILIEGIYMFPSVFTQNNFNYVSFPLVPLQILFFSIQNTDSCKNTSIWNKFGHVSNKFF